MINEVTMEDAFVLFPDAMAAFPSGQLSWRFEESAGTLTAVLVPKAPSIRTRYVWDPEDGTWINEANGVRVRR